MPSSGEDILRLAAVIDRQRRELDRARSGAAARSVIDMARGALMERLGCSATEAESQLTALAAEAGTPVAEIAAAVIGHDPVPPVPPVQPGLARPDGPARNRLAGAAAELAADGSEIAAAVLDQALAPLRASAVALWLIDADGGLDLLGEAGLGPAEASRWRRIPPQMDCPAQRVAHDGANLWWPGTGGAPDGYTGPLAGRWPDGARAVLALRDRASMLLGVMEVCWPLARDGFPDALRQQVSDLAQACGDLLSTRIEHGDLAIMRSRSALTGLLDSLLETALIASALRDGDGNVTDFRIDHAGDLPGPGRAERRRDRRAHAAGDLPHGRDGGPPAGARGPRPHHRARSACSGPNPERPGRRGGGGRCRRPDRAVLRRDRPHLAAGRRGRPAHRAAPADPAARPDRRLGGEPGHRDSGLDRRRVRAVRPARAGGRGHPRR